MRWHLKQTQQLVPLLNTATPQTLALDIDKLREQVEAAELTLFSQPGTILVSSSNNPSEILPSLPDEHSWRQLRQQNAADFVALSPVRNNQLMIRVIVKIATATPLYLQALYPVPVRMADLADSVEFAFVRYQEMSFLRHSLKITFSLALSLVLLMSLLAAIWVAFISIRHIIAPVKALVKGTQAVASGQYDQQLPVMAQDDLGFLVESFNIMTQRIARASHESNMAGLEVENQRAYLETILANLTAGVMSFDANFHIRTANQAAYRIFRMPVASCLGYSLPELADHAPELAEPLKIMQQLLTQADDIWEQRLAFVGINGRQELLCRGTPLLTQQGSAIGAVVVFDDVTDLIQAQKNAAWGEVARRLAHEIKNPLTPIQLSAERLQHKLTDKLSETDAVMLKRSTATIVQQVEAMKEMVSDFAEYAKHTRKQTVIIDMPLLVQEVLALYVSRAGITFKTQYATNSALLINGDPVSMRQVLHNLLKNALEAIDTKGIIEINLQRVTKNSAEFIEIALYDDGPGIKEEQLETIFEPYVTTKAKGTGLGLAIVKKIIEEHGGNIWVDTRRTAGAGFIIHLPLVQANHAVAS
jgi:nitrogen fixation/metabolism regulation signal transduction histidine kinase